MYDIYSDLNKLFGELEYDIKNMKNQNICKNCLYYIKDVQRCCNKKWSNNSPVMVSEIDYCSCFKKDMNLSKRDIIILESMQKLGMNFLMKEKGILYFLEKTDNSERPNIATFKYDINKEDLFSNLEIWETYKISDFLKG